MKKILILFLFSISLNAQNNIEYQVQTTTDSVVKLELNSDSITTIVINNNDLHRVNHNFWDIGLGAQLKATSIAVNYSYRAKQWMVRSGLVGSIYQLKGTAAYEYSTQLRLGADYHFLNYGFLHSWSSGKKQYRWSPFIHAGILSGVRYIHNYENVIYDGVDRWNYLQSLETAIGVKYSPKNIFGWHTNGWLTFVGAGGYVSSNMDGNYFSFHIGVNYIIGY